MKRLLFLILTAISYNANAVVVAVGNSTTANTTFTKAVNTAAFDRTTQTFYVGLAASAGTSSVSKALTSVSGSPHFSPLSGGNVDDALISDLIHFTMEAGGQGMLAFHSGTLPNIALGVMRDDGTRYAATGTLLLADNSTACTRIHTIIGDQNGHIFAIVSGADTTAWAAANDAIARVTVTDASPLTFSLDAPLDVDTTAFSIEVDGGAPTITNATALAYTPDMGGRLYVGASVLTAANQDDASFSVAAFSVSSTGALANLTLTANNATCTDTILSTSPIAVENANAATQSVTCTKIAVMKTSTGFYYLITCGGPEANSAQGNSRNKVYALPLVSGNATDAINGTLASTDLTTADFSVQASAQAHMGLITDTDVLVGGGNLPIAADDANKTVSDLFVTGDTVYCGLKSDAVNATNAPGIYYSQAIFNELGKIIRWTDWAKAAPFNVGTSTTDGSVLKFAVNAVTGDIIAVTSAGTVVNKTAWTTTGVDSNSLVSQLNSWFSNGCFSAYDLNQSIANFGNQTTHRYAFFGGAGGKVVFTRISTAESAAYAGIQRTLTTDFTAATDFYETSITGDSSPVIALGYSKDSTANEGYFFAGTKNGLYAWALTATGAGFTGSALAALNTAPFASTYSWQQITNIEGEVKKIKSTGNQVYVLTRDLDRTNTTFTDKVYRISMGTTVSALNTNTVLLATSGTGSGTASDFSSATLFFDLFPLPGAADFTDDKLLLATNDGLFQSALAVEDDTTQTGAAWTQVSNPATDGVVYDLLAGPTHSRAISTIWASNRYDHTGHSTYMKSEWRQIVSDDDATTVADLPNAQFCSDGSSINHVVPTNYLWSDGARRFFIGIPNTSDGLHNNIYLQPYRVGTSDWNITAERGPLSNSALASQERYHWVQAIGATGVVYAGGNKGAVSLE